MPVVQTLYHCYSITALSNHIVSGLSGTFIGVPVPWFSIWYQCSSHGEQNERCTCYSNTYHMNNMTVLLSRSHTRRDLDTSQTVVFETYKGRFMYEKSMQLRVKWKPAIIKAMFLIQRQSNVTKSCITELKKNPHFEHPLRRVS